MCIVIPSEIKQTVNCTTRSPRRGGHPSIGSAGIGTSFSAMPSARRRGPTGRSRFILFSLSLPVPDKVVALGHAGPRRVSKVAHRSLEFDQGKAIAPPATSACAGDARQPSRDSWESDRVNFIRLGGGDGHKLDIPWLVIRTMALKTLRFRWPL